VGGGSVRNSERKFHSRPHGIDAGDLLSIDRVGEWPGANAIDIATVINETARGFDGLLGAWMLCDTERATSWPNTIGPAVENGNSVFLLNLHGSRSGVILFPVGHAGNMARVTLI
jgi:hypothetical protein